MLPSGRLAIAVAAPALLFVLGALFPPLIAVGVLYLLSLAVYATVDLLALPRRRSFDFERRAPERVSLGVGVPVEVEIVNRSRRSQTISVAEDLAEDLETEPAACKVDLDPGERATLQYRLTARRRGPYTLDAMDVRILPARGLFYRQFRLKQASELQVVPNVQNITRYQLLLRRGMEREAGVARLRQAGRGTEFESLRLYVPGDEMARVDWKATARRGQLVIRNRQPERRQSILVLLDVGRATAGEFRGLNRLDYLINATLMLSYVALRQRDRFGLLAFSNRIESYLPVVQDIAGIEKVVQALYKLQPQLVESDYGRACHFLAARHSKRSLVCLMTDVIDRHASNEVLDYLAQMARYHLAMAVTLRNPEVQELADQPLRETEDAYVKAVALDAVTARQEALAAMRRRGVDVLDVGPEMVLPALLNRYALIKSRGRL